MSKEPKELLNLAMYDSRFAIESATRDGKPVFLVTEHSSDGATRTYAENTYLDAIRRFAVFMDAQVVSYQRGMPGCGLSDNEVLTESACIEGSRQDDYKGKVVVLNPEALRPEYRFASEQLFFAEDGFGCSPAARGKLVIGNNLYSGNAENHTRDEFMGIADPKKLPSWAITVLRKHTEPEKTHGEHPKDRRHDPPSR